MSNGNRIKAEFLGMPYGTAMNRLRKQLMFKFLKELGYDVCYKCETLIESAEELSIEHKEPWLGRDVDKFWDLDNIAFSHLRCNTRHNTGKKEGPEGTAWCCVHQQFLPVEEFWPSASRWNGYRNMCKTCDMEYTMSKRSSAR